MLVIGGLLTHVVVGGYTLSLCQPHSSDMTPSRGEFTEGFLDGREGYNYAHIDIIMRTLI